MLPWHTTGIYDNPKEFGLELIASEDIAGSYEFDMIAVWRDNDGKYWAAHDSGCSCPMPFENTSKADLTEITSSADLNDYIKKEWVKYDIETGDNAYSQWRVRENENIDERTVDLISTFRRASS